MSFLIPLLILGLASLSGSMVISAAHIFREKITVLLTGTITGLSVYTLAMYALQYFTIITKPILITSLIVLSILSYLIFHSTPAWQNWKKYHLDQTAAIIFVLLFLLFSLIAPKLLIEKPDGLHTGIINAYGDLGFHVSTITLLAEQQTFLPQNPILAGTRLTYPFFANYFSALLYIAGASLTQSVILPALILIPVSLTLLYCFGKKLTSKKTGILVVILLILSGGTLGWIQIFSDFSNANAGFIEFITHLPKNYTGHSLDPARYFIINPIISLLLPQRAFLFGMPISLTILLLLLQNKTKSHIIAGILSGLLPFFHAHSAIALAFFIVIITLNKPGKRWLYYFAITAITGLPAVLYYATSPSSASVLPHVQLWWMAHQENPIIFWIRNTGLILPITVIGLFLPAKKIAKLSAIAGLLIFTAGNIWLFAAWEWDNTKLFIYWFIFTLPLTAHLALRFLKSKNVLVKGVTTALILAHLLSGSLDIFQITLPNSPTWREWDNYAIAFAEQIKKDTRPSDIILTAPYHNSPVALTGRAHYMGFAGQVWTHGYDYLTRNRAIQNFYTGQVSQLPEADPRYAVVGPVEREKFPNLAIQPSWQLINQTGPYQLYSLPTSN